MMHETPIIEEPKAENQEEYRFFHCTIIYRVAMQSVNQLATLLDSLNDLNRERILLVISFDMRKKNALGLRNR